MSLRDGVNVRMSGLQGLAAHVEAWRARRRHRAHMVIDIPKGLAGKGQARFAPQEWRSSTEPGTFGLCRPDQGPFLNEFPFWLSNTEIAFNINFRFVLVDFDLATLQRIAG